MARNRPIRYFIFLMAILLSGNIFAQEIAVKGTVYDAKKKEPLGYCSVVIMNTYFGAHTDEDGNFVVMITKELSDAKLIFSYVGYDSDTLQLQPGKTAYTIFLNPSHSSLNEVVVTGESKTSEVSESPILIKVISAKEIEQTTESNVVDVLAKNVPGMNAIKTGPNVSKPFIRGLGYNRVLTLYDGIPQEAQQFEDEEVLAVDMYNIENAEVILGPATLQYGPEALAGVIDLVLSTPLENDKKIHGRFFSEYQSNNGLIGNGLRLNYGNNHWSFVGRGTYRIAGNFSNHIDGKVYNTGFRELNVSGSIVHKSSKGYSSLNFATYDNHQGIPDGSRDSLTRQFTKAIYDDPDDDLTTRPVVSEDELNSYKLSPIYQNIRHFRVYTKNQYELKNGDNVYGMFSFQQNQRKEHDFPIQKSLLGVSMYLNTYNYDLQYNYHQLKNTDLTFGVNGAYQTNKNVIAHDIPIPDYHMLDIGSFVTAKWKKDNWTVNSGLRFDMRYVTGHDFYTREDSATELLSQVFVPDTAGAELLFPAFRKIYGGVSSNIGASYQFKNVIVKANVSQGFRPPHVSEFGSNGLDGSAHSYFIGKEDLRSEFNWQVDLGAHLNYKNISAGVSVFTNYIKNYIYLVQLVDNNGNPIELIPDNKTFQFQQTNAVLTGMEATVDVHPVAVKGFSFVSNLSMVYGFNLDDRFKGKGNDGAYLPSIPPWRLLNVLNEDIALKCKAMPVISLRTEVDFNAAQKRFLALNSTETETPAYTLWNTSINFSFQYTKKSVMQLQFQVNNLLDKAYQSNMSRLKYFEYYADSPNGHFGIYNMGRNFCLKMILPF